jgi:1-aminocyclopropane-1-carboxylate deaminase/D-cysteine desulfhydrase-like pyridoxal-dependent ACC family enzyme
MDNFYLTTNTPIELIEKGIYVKREDLTCPHPGPPFAKIRGLYRTLPDLDKQKVPAVGYMDTTISQAGWGISFLCEALKLKIKPVIYYPSYKDGVLRHNAELHIKKWKQFGADVHPIQASKLSIMRAMANQHLRLVYPGAYMLPQGLPSQYTIEAVAEEVATVPAECLTGSIVISLGSGVMAAGVLKGLAQVGAAPTVYGVLVAPKNRARMRAKVLQYAGLCEGGFFDAMTAKLELVDIGYEYEDFVNLETPFPCNSYYDKKAWAFVCDKEQELEGPILFWNIGGDSEDNPT